jgi:hypothetical protein
VTVKDDARMLLLQAAVLSELKNADTATRQMSLDGWDPGDNVTGWYGDIPLGKVRVQGGLPEAVVADPPLFLAWCEEYWPEAVRENPGRPTEEQITQAAVALAALVSIDPDDPGRRRLARNVMVAALTTWTVHAGNQKALLDQVANGEVVVAGGQEWSEVPGVTIRASTVSQAALLPELEA